MASSPVVESSSHVSFTILSNGNEIPATYEILSISTEQSINKVAGAEIVLRDGDPGQQTFDVTDADTFKPGAEIEIKLGYVEQTDSIFKGIVVKQSIKIDGSEGSRLFVECKDKALKSTINRNNAIFEKIKDSALIQQLAGNYSLSTDITGTSVEHKEIVQFYSTDWDFMVSRAEVNGMILITDSGKLTMAKPDVSASPALKLTYGYDIIEFDGELDATNQYSEVKSNAWDMSGQKVINATASEPSVNAQGDISGKELAKVLSVGTRSENTTAPIQQASVKTWADAVLLKSRLSAFKGTMTFQGSSKAKVNSTIQLTGLSGRFNGNAYISGVTHIVEDGKWDTIVTMGMSAEWFSQKHRISGPIASGLLPGVKGLQTGIVKKIYEDPDNEFRVQVEIPILGDDGKSVWARLATFYAGKSVGAFFMPEVNDEVILGFMNDDPRFPIILGSLYSSSISAPETPDEKNKIKTIITQSKLQLKFDEEDKVITLLTPGGNTLEISDKGKGITLTDQNKNEIQMNNEGITINSKSNLTLKASESVKISGLSISIDGTEAVKATGGQVTITGNETASLKGNAECEVSSSGETSVKGTMVMIN